MIAASLAAECFGAEDGQRFSGLLRAPPGNRIEVRRMDRLLLAKALPHNTRWASVTGIGGWSVLFSGQLHNQRSLANQLGVAGSDPAIVFAAALDRWADAADEHCIGHYATIAVLPGSAALRLSRSPFQALPLHFRQDGALASVMPLPRSLFWREAERPQPDLDRVGRALLNEYSERYRSWYHGARQVPLGTAIELRPEGWREVWRYDLFTRPRITLPKRSDYVEAALALLDEGVAAALDGSTRPAILLSGGLDSASVAASALRALPGETPLLAYTFGPEQGWDAIPPPGAFLSDFPAVQAFAKANPRVVLTCETNPGRDFRFRQRELLEASDGAPTMLGLAWIEHALYQAARDNGCDVMLCGTWGNMTFSSSAPWAYSEYLRRGQWGKLRRELQLLHGDSRPLWQRFVALAIMPQLPRGLWQLIKRLRHGSVPSALALSAASPDWPGLEAAMQRSRTAGSDLARADITSKRAFWRSLLAEDGQDQDQYALGMEILHGLPKRDPTAYRPLVEFCWGCPTGVFKHNGQDRWLAREMARGRLPEAQRINRDYGKQYVDTLARIGRVRDELLAELERMTEDADIAAVVDLPRLQQLLREFPAAGPHYDPAEVLPYQTILPLGIAAGRFIAFAKGRNDL
jgi:asparagine synthase (glutamine-hydrolysing)